MAYGDDVKTTKLDVEYAYRLILGREPENNEVVMSKLGGTFAEMRSGILQSPEFQNNFASVNNILLEADYSPQDIEYEASEKQMARMLSHIESVWGAYGEGETYWSVVTDNAYTEENLTQQALDTFYGSGAATLRQIEMTLRRCGEWGDFRQKLCMEYGCGVGRVTMHLARVFKHVTGMDISTGHLAKAKNYSQKLNLTNIDFQRVGKLTDLEVLSGFDFIFSVIVLQHNPPPIMAQILAHIFKLLKPGGIAMFQLPVRILNYSFHIGSYLANMAAYDSLEMHALPQNVVLKIAREHGCYPLEIQCDAWTGASYMVSQSFVFKKDARA